MGGKTFLLSADDLAQMDKLTACPIAAYVKNMYAKGYKCSDVYNKYIELEKKLSIPVSEAYK